MTVAAVAYNNSFVYFSNNYGISWVIWDDYINLTNTIPVNIYYSSICIYDETTFYTSIYNYSTGVSLLYDSNSISSEKKLGCDINLGYNTISSQNNYNNNTFIGTNTVANYTRQYNSIAIGSNAGQNAGYSDIQNNSIAIGSNAGYNGLQYSSIAIGSNADFNGQNSNTIISKKTINECPGF